MPYRKHFKHFTLAAVKKSFSPRQTMVFSRFELFTKIVKANSPRMGCGYLAALDKLIKRIKPGNARIVYICIAHSRPPNPSKSVFYCGSQTARQNFAGAEGELVEFQTVPVKVFVANGVHVPKSLELCST